ncbi:hypothetical protein, partial [Streptomyces sp. NPDC057052]|uniref:hypothetical protein n=1 Tax=Streptomyces sp. NPDC057052 TaxID=3346010 RepID=UPI00363C9808
MASGAQDGTRTTGAGNRTPPAGPPFGPPAARRPPLAAGTEPREADFRVIDVATTQGAGCRRPGASPRPRA